MLMKVTCGCGFTWSRSDEDADRVFHQAAAVAEAHAQDKGHEPFAEMVRTISFAELRTVIEA